MRALRPCVLVLCLLCGAQTPSAFGQADSLYARLAEAAPDERPEVLNALAWHYIQHDLYMKGVEYSVEAYHEAKALGDLVGMGRALDRMGAVYYYREQFDEALAHSREAIEMYRQAGYRQGEMEMLNNTALIYRNADSLHKSVEYLQAALHVGQAHELDNQPIYANALGNLGGVYALLGRDAEAEAHFRQALALYATLPEARGWHVARTNIAYAERLLEREALGEAATHAAEAERLLTSAVTMKLLARLHRLQYRLAWAQRDYARAHEYNERFIAATDSLHRSQRERDIDDVQAQYKIVEQEQKIALLEADQQRSATVKNFLVVGGVLGLLFTVVLGWLYLRLAHNHRRLERSEKRLAKRNRDLQEARDRANAAAAAKHTFLANMSHEIRTPLNGVLGMTAVLDGTDLDEDQQECVRLVQTSGTALMGVLNDILDISKVEAGKLDIDPAPFAPRQLFDDALALIRPQALAKGLSLSLDVDTSVPARLCADAARVQQVVNNLLSNAVKFTSAGRIHVDVKANVLEGTAYRLHFCVHDTGIGIPADKVEDLFGAFAQLDASTTREYGGTGLGLTISRHLVELMGGRIWVESQEGAGSTFHASIRAEAVADAPVVTTERSANMLPPLDILVAEDNLINQMVARKTLEQFGYDAEFVGNGRAALDALAQRSFDVVLMDIQMPEMDGMEATRRIRKGGYGTPYIVALTAHALEEEREAAFASGMDAFLSKPFKPEQLRTSLLHAADALRDGRTVSAAA